MDPCKFCNNTHSGECPPGSTISIHALFAEIDRLRAQVAALTAERDRLRARAEAAEARLKEKEEELEDAESDINAVVPERNLLLARVKVLEEAIRSHKAVIKGKAYANFDINKALWKVLDLEVKP